MAAAQRILDDEHSVIQLRHAAIASLFAAGSIAAGMFLTVAGSQLYEQTSQRVLWALAAGPGLLVG